MHEPASEAYFVTQVQTATPERLRMLLIQGAVRAAETARQHREKGDNQAAGTALLKCYEIVGELLRSASVDRSELGQKVAGLYVYLFRTLTEALWDLEPKKINDVISVLRVEAATWQEVCQALGAGQLGGGDGAAVDAPAARSDAVLPPAADAADGVPPGLSMEA